VLEGFTLVLLEFKEPNECVCLLLCYWNATISKYDDMRGTCDYINTIDLLLNVPLLSLSRRSKMVPKRYEESTPSPSTRGKVTRSEITSWLGHIIMNTLDIDTIFSITTYVIIRVILWNRINVGCQCTHGLGEVHVVD
jgi:hypothetical protein